MEGALGLWIVLGWVAPMIVAVLIGAGKGKGMVGFLLGLFLSWIGVIIVLVMEDSTEKDRRHQETLTAVSGGGGGTIVKVRCPSCQALVDENAKFCPECATQI